MHSQEKLPTFVGNKERTMRKKVYQYVMLFASVVMLLSVVVPHHHHADGSPCYRWLAVELAGGEHEQPAHHDCGCNGHNIALNTVLSQQATDGDAHLHLFPLLVLFDSVNPVPPLIHRLCRDGSEWFFAEALPDARLAAASGRRAPPFDVC